MDNTKNITLDILPHPHPKRPNLGTIERFHPITI